MSNQEKIKWLERKVTIIQEEVERHRNRLDFAKRNLKEHQKWLAELKAIGGRNDS